MDSSMKKLLFAFVPLAVVMTLALMAVYGAGQHLLRQGVNDPQIELAEDTSAALRTGAPVASLSLPNPVDFAVSLAPFVNVYDANKQTVASSGHLSGKVATPPLGVFDYARVNGEHRFTWQPRKDARIASILVYYKGPTSEGYVLAGRSVREQENRIRLLGVKLVWGWVISMLFIFLLIIGRVRFAR